MGPEGGSLMIVKDFSFLLISNVLGWGCSTGRGPTNDDKGFIVSVDFKCSRKGV